MCGALSQNGAGPTIQMTSPATRATRPKIPSGLIDARAIPAPRPRNSSAISRASWRLAGLVPPGTTTGRRG